MTEELETIWKETVVAKLGVLCRNLIQGTEPRFETGASEITKQNC
jgi:hypothetical protein